MQRGFSTNLLTLLIASLVAATGCATVNQANRQETPGVAVRVPLVESPKVSLRTEVPKRPPAEPESVADEYRGRWLTFFEISFPPPRAEQPVTPLLPPAAAP